MKSLRDGAQERYFEMMDKYKALQEKFSQLQEKHQALQAEHERLVQSLATRKAEEEKKPAVFRVDIWEHERGWGQRVDETREFGTEMEAKEFVRMYNASNEPAVNGVAPDWFMIAKYVGKS